MYDLLEAEILEIMQGGTRKVKFHYKGIFNEILDQIGLMPLPPYIHEELKQKERYQTVYAKYNGSAAAPTAGLHFTEELLEKLQTENRLLLEENKKLNDTVGWMHDTIWRLVRKQRTENS